jgi:hypothetical protein
LRQATKRSPGYSGELKLDQIVLIEQVQLQLPLLNERADRRALERGDPADTLGLAHLVDGLIGDHAAIADHHHLLDAEVRAQAPHLGHERLAVGGVARVHRYRHWAATRIGEQAVVDLQLTLLAVAIVAALGERTARALEVARRQVVEHQAALAQMARGQLLLDRVLAREQPVHRRVQVVLVGIGDAEVFGQRRGVPPARGRKLGVRRHDARGHHRQHQVALATRLGGNHRGQSQPLHGRDDRLHVAVRT